MFFARGKPDDIAGMDFFDGAAEALDAAGAGDDDQGLAERVGVPGGAGTGLEGDAGTGDAGWGGGLEEGIDAYGAGEPVGGSFAGGF